MRSDLARFDLDSRVDLLTAARHSAPVNFLDDDGRIIQEFASFAVDEDDLGLPDGVGDLLDRIRSAANPAELFAWFEPRGC